MYKITLPGGLAMMHKRIYRKDSLIKKNAIQESGTKRCLQTEEKETPPVERESMYREETE